MIIRHTFNIILLAIGFSLIFTAHHISKRFEKPTVIKSLDENSYTLNKEFLRLFSLGNYKAISSLLWTQTMLFSDLNHVKDKNNSWMYRRFKTIAFLSPFFYENYLFGGIYLSVVKDDIENAQTIFDLGIRQFPTDYSLLWYGGYNAYLEIHDYDKALNYFKIIKNNYGIKKFPALPLVLSSLNNKKGNTDVAIKLLITAYKKTDNEKIKKRILEKIQKYKTEGK